MSTIVADGVIAGLGPTFRRWAGPLLRPWIEAMCAEQEITRRWVEPTRKGWATAWDLDACPDPAWLGQVIGTIVPPGITAEQQREYLRTRPQWLRGTPAAIIAAAKSVLVGSQRVELVERDGSPWRLTILVYQSELAGKTAADVAAAVARHKPAGILLNVEVLTGATYAHMRDKHGPTYADFAAAFPTYQSARDHLPET